MMWSKQAAPTLCLLALLPALCVPLHPVMNFFLASISPFELAWQVQERDQWSMVQASSSSPPALQAACSLVRESPA